MRARNIKLYVLFDLNEKESRSKYDEWASERQGLSLEEIDEISKEQVAKKKIFNSCLTKKNSK